MKKEDLENCITALDLIINNDKAMYHLDVPEEKMSEIDKIFKEEVNKYQITRNKLDAELKSYE
jgi:nitrogen regulatory protein PII-like uncharacterized protein